MPLPEFTNKHHRSIRTNIIERSNREIKHRTRVVSSFSDGNSAPPYLEHRPSILGTSLMKYLGI